MTQRFETRKGSVSVGSLEPESFSGTVKVRSKHGEQLRDLKWYHGSIRSGTGSSELSALQLGTRRRIQRTGTAGQKEWLARGPPEIQRWNRRKF